MPDPTWTDEYNLQSSPEDNGFGRQLVGIPTIVEQTTGSPANRRVEIQSDLGDVIFTTAAVPSLDEAVGASAEVDVEVTGQGDAGFEFTFLDGAALVNVFSDLVNLSIPQGDDGTPGTELNFASNNTVPIRIRLTVDPSRNVRLYRALIADLVWSELTNVSTPPVAPVTAKPFQRVLWWGEGGGTQIFRGLRYFTGGPVVPG